MKKQLLLAIFSIIALRMFAQTNPTQTFVEYNKKNVNEFVYLHTDREVYYVGDTIWFSAYIRTLTYLAPSKLSLFLNIKLIGVDETKVLSQKYFIDFSQVSGQITIDQKIKEGYYYLVAYSSWQENFSDIESMEIFRKKILIKDETSTNYKLRAVFNKTNYKHGDTVIMRLFCNDEMNNPVENVKYSYVISTNNDKNYIKSKTEQYISFIADTSKNSSQKLGIQSKYMGYDLDTFFNIPVSQKIDITFYPEGGRCINNLSGNLAFKAIYSNGMPATIGGNIIDDKGNMVAMVFAEHDGMGAINYTPQKNKKYYLILDNNFSQSFELPSGIDIGWQMKVVKQDSVNIWLDISNTTADTIGFITLQVRNHILTFQKNSLHNQTTLKIRTDSLPAGICVITLFSPDYVPVAERLVFVNYENLCNAELFSSSKTYKPRNKTELNLKLRDKNNKPVKGNFSISVYDEEFGESSYLNNNSLPTTALLATEIKGKILNGDYYFNPENQNVKRHLDLLLLTQGWRNYRYTNIDKQNYPTLHDFISGRVEYLKFGKGWTPVKDADINVFSSFNSFALKTDSTGTFRFIPIFENIKKPCLHISTKDKKGRDKYSVILDQNKFENRLDSLIHIFNKNQIESIIPLVKTFNTGSPQLTDTKNNHWIEEVTVRSKKFNEDDFASYKILERLGETRQIPSGEIKTNSSMVILLRNNHLLVEEREDILYTRYEGKEIPIKFYFDDCELDTKDVLHIPISSISKIVISRGFATEKIEGSPVVVFIYSKRGFVNPNAPIPFVLIKFDYAKEFFQQKYENEMELALRTIDIRRTIHWATKLETNKKGEATIKFYNADRYTRIKCVVQGFTKNDIPFAGEYKYQITELP